MRAKTILYAVLMFWAILGLLAASLGTRAAEPPEPPVLVEPTDDETEGGELSSTAVSQALNNSVWLPLVARSVAAPPATPTPPSASGPGRVFSTSVAPATGEAMKGSKFQIWVPDGVPIIRGIYIYGPGCGASSLGTGGKDNWAQKWGLARLGMEFPNTSCPDWIDPKKGSGRALLTALQTFAQQSGHPELADAPFVLWGVSGGGIWTMNMVVTYPERIAAAFPRAGGWSTTVNRAALGIPVMLSSGEKDGFRPEPTLTLYRAEGAVWSIAVEPNNGHCICGSKPLSFIFFDAVLGQRLPPSPPASGPVTLRQVDQARAWLGDVTTKEIAPAAQYQGDKLKAAWLPDEYTARKWQEFVKTGKVTP